MMYATPADLGFYKEIGLIGSPTDFELELDRKKFKVTDDPFVHVTSNFLNHRATHVFNTTQTDPPDPTAERLVLKVNSNSFLN